MTAPATTSHGYVDEYAQYGPFFGDILELVPELRWPTSVFTYAQMQHDPQLAAILKAYAYPIVRAGWHLDPMGARPEVVTFVADDLGITVKGDERSPSGARVRGVRWAEHLRAVLPSLLIYGYSAFEQEAPIGPDGKAHLTALHERSQSTFSEIRADRNGQLEGAYQYNAPRDAQGHAIPIPATQLQWYAHERRGSAWQGNSLLRPAYGPWLLKREMLRVLAISSRRHGAGVPTMEALPGTTPGPGQMEAAQRQASAVRAGDTAGMSVPPGFRFALTGLTGSVPDTLGYVRYLDQQMTRMALAGIVDLGDTQRGSRALGEVFVDLMLLALQEVADQVAADVTAQTVARIVEWNWGITEPVPAVVCEDVGAIHETTAESLALLLNAGALSTDPALEEYIRSTWKLPVRDPSTPWQAPGMPTSTPIAARARARAR